MWSSSFPASWRALFLLLALGCVCIPLTAQSTTSEPPQQETRQWNNADTVTSLSEALKLIDATLLILEQARNEAEGLRQDSASWAEEALTLSAELTKERSDSEELERSSRESLSRLEKLVQTSKDRAALDQKAIDEARAQRMAWAGGGFLVGAALTAVTVFVLRR